MLRIVVILGVVVVVVVALIASKILLVLPEGTDPQREAVARVFRTAEEKGAEAGWTAAGEVFRAEVPLEDFEADLERLHAALGAFRELGPTSERREEAERVELIVPVRFERGDARGAFRVVLEDDAWRLGGYDVRIPVIVRARAERDVLEALARDLLRLFGESQWEAMRETFAPELLASWPESRFEDDMRRLHERLGDVRSAELRGIDEVGEAAALRFDLVFDRGTGHAHFEWEHDDEGWLLTALEIDASA